MRCTLLVVLTSILLLPVTALAAEPPDSQAFHPERYRHEIDFTKLDRYAIQWTINFQDFLTEQTEQLRLELEKSKPVKFVREIPLTTATRGPGQIQPEHIPSLQVAAARW
ncbi:MAG: hypothetical protein HY814_07840 [Candidatus Riflebacteria bacterium]|nr:hypothetical protein [Candidatus Riflebacteria bacterium]